MSMILTIIIYLFIENSLVFNECLSIYLKVVILL